MIGTIDGLRAVFAEISGTVEVLFEDSFELINLFLFLVEFFLLLAHLSFVGVHKFSDHVLELDDLLFHTFVERLRLFEVSFELWDWESFNFDEGHKFVDHKIRDLNDFLFEEVELSSESGQYGFEIKDWLLKGMWSVVTNWRSLASNAWAVKTYKLSGCFKDIVPFVDHFSNLLLFAGKERLPKLLLTNC